MAATWPSIIPEGATTWAPAPAWATADLGVALEGEVVVDLAAGVEDPAVAVVGVLVEAQVGDQHQPVAQLVGQPAQGHLDDAVRIAGPAADGVLGCGHPEEDHGRHAQRRQPVGLLDQGLGGVLDHAGQGRDGLGLVDALPHEQGGDQVGGGQRRLGHQFAQPRRLAQPAHPGRGEGHDPHGIFRPARPSRATMRIW